MIVGSAPAWPYGIIDPIAELAGVAIGLDRQERGQAELSAIQEIERSYNIPVLSIIGMEHLIDYLKQEGGTSLQVSGSMEAYRDRYGV